MIFPAKPWTDGQISELIPNQIFVYDAAKGAWLLETSEDEAKLLASIDSDFQHFTGKIAVINGSIATIEGDVVTLRSDLEAALATRAAAVDAEIARIDSTTLSQFNFAQALDMRLVTAENEIDTLQSEMTAVLSNSSDNTAAIANLRLEADSDVALISANAAVATAQAGTISGILASLDSDGVNIQSLRTDLEAEIALTNSEIATLQGAGTDQAAANADVDSDLGAVNARVDFLSGTVDERFSNANTAIVAQGVEIDNIELNVADNLASIGDLYTAVQTLTAADVIHGRIWKQATAPLDAQAADLWYDTSSNKMFSYDSTYFAWVQVN